MVQAGKRFAKWWNSMLSGNKKFVVCFVGFVIFFTVMAAWFGYFDKRAFQRAQFLQETTEMLQKERVVIKYIPKEFKEDADVEYVEVPKQITVKVNKKEHKFDLLESETQKFENGKVVIEKESKINLNVQTPAVPAVRFGVEGDVNSHGAGAGIVLTRKFNNHAEADVYWHMLGDNSVGVRVKAYF